MLQEEIDILEQAASWQGLTDQQICIQIEKKRRKLDLDKCTKVTPETFKVWREKKDQEDKKLAEVQAAEEQAKLKATGRKVHIQLLCMHDVSTLHAVLSFSSFS